MWTLKRVVMLLMITLLGLVSGLVRTSVVQAAGGITYTVAQGGSATCSFDGTDYVQSGDNFGTIQEALYCAQQDGPAASTPDTISIAAGTYTGTGNYNLDVSTNVSIEGKPGSTTIDAQQQGPGLKVDPVAAVSLSGLTIINGRGSSFGGGIFNGGTLSISNSILSDNTASTGRLGYGGGIYNDVGGMLTVSNTTVNGNTGCSMENCRGFGGGIVNFGTLTISHSSLSGNTACDGILCEGLGGGLRNGGTLRVTNSTLGGMSTTDGNSACSASACLGFGGGIWNDSFYPTGTLPVTLTHDTISFNTAYSGTGSSGGVGGILTGSSSLILHHDTFTNNQPPTCLDTTNPPTNALAGCPSP